MFKTIIKYLKQWNEDYQYAVQELNKEGYFIFYHSGGSVCYKVDRITQPKLTTHINTCDDKPSAIPTKD